MSPRKKLIELPLEGGVGSEPYWFSFEMNADAIMRGNATERNLMAVLIEGISVVVRRERIDAAYPGGWPAFVADCPNRTLCADPDLARIGFLVPADVQAFSEGLERAGLTFQSEGAAVDFAVVDQQRGPTSPCSWLDWGHVEIGGHRVAACRLVGSTERKLATPDGWRYEDSLSASNGFIPTGAEGTSLVFLRSERGTDVFLNRLTGKEVYIGRASDAPIGGRSKRTPSA